MALEPFESETCSRCGGTGNYSYCQTYGTTCFKCRGAKTVLTKRGAEAQRWEQTRRMYRIHELSVGSRIYWEGIPGFTKSGWVTVQGLGYSPDSVPFIETALGIHHGADSMFLMASSPALRASALAYQATLTKTGKPKKNNNQ